MSNYIEAYTSPIKKGEVRIVINIEAVNIENENSGVDSDSGEEDTMFLHLDFSDFGISPIPDKGFKLMSSKIRNSKYQLYELKKNSIWFDIDIEKVSGVLNNDIHFHVEGSQSKFKNYYIKDLNYKIEWLQYDKNRDSISTVSVTNKNFQQAITELNIDYSIEEISKCASLLAKAIKRIDLRTGTAYVKLNTEDGKYDPVLVVMAVQLGYQVEVLDDDTISDLLKRGQKATHLISLILNY